MSLRKAINSKCKECIYDPLSGLGTWRQQVESCTVTSCGLYPVRPKSKGLKKIDSSDSAWDAGELGRDENFVRVSESIDSCERVKG